MPVRSTARRLAKEQVEKKYGLDVAAIIFGLSYLFASRSRSDLQQIAIEVTAEFRTDGARFPVGKSFD